IHLVRRLAPQHHRFGSGTLRGRPPQVPAQAQGQLMMGTFKASDGTEVAYYVDDYTDPWREVDTVILLHAAMGSSTRFYAWVPHLMGDFRVVRMDMRGHGGTKISESTQLSVERIAMDVAQLADHLGAREFHVGG